MARIPRAPAAPSVLESEIVSSIRLALDSEEGLELWRNGVAGVQATDAEGNARHHRAGLPRGSSDLIGVLGIAVKIRTWNETERRFDLGDTILIGRLVCLEVKRPGVKVKSLALLEAMRVAGKVLNKKDLHDYEQQLWMIRVRLKGGFACYVRTVEEARAAIKRARRGERE